MGRGIVEASPLTVWEAVKNPLSRYIYDNMLKVLSFICFHKLLGRNTKTSMSSSELKAQARVQAFSRKKRDCWCLGEIHHRPSATLDFSAPEPVVLLGPIALWRKACSEMLRGILRTLNSTEGKLSYFFYHSIALTTAKLWPNCKEFAANQINDFSVFLHRRAALR